MATPASSARRRRLHRRTTRRRIAAVAAVTLVAAWWLAPSGAADLTPTAAGAGADVVGEVRYHARDQRSAWTGRAPLRVDVFDVDLADVTTARVEASVRAAELRSGNALRDYSARTTVFDAGAYPEVRFRLTRVVGSIDPLDGADHVLDVIGDLTVRDVTREVVAVARLRIDDERVHADVRFEVSLAAFGLGAPRFLTLVVEDAVVVEVDASWPLGPGSTTTTP